MPTKIQILLRLITKSKVTIKTSTCSTSIQCTLFSSSHRVQSHKEHSLCYQPGLASRH